MKNSISKIGIGICFFLLITPIRSDGQTKWEKSLYKADEYYDIGDYAKSIKSLSKFNKKASKKLGSDHEYLLQYQLQMAQNSLASGFLDDFTSRITETVASSSRKFGDNTVDHAKILLESAELYIVYGNFLIAENYVEEAKKTIESSGRIEDNLSAKIQLTTAEIYSGQGYYNKALSYIEDIEKYFANRAVSKETYVDALSGKLKTRKLNPKEVQDRLSDYATLLILRAKTIGKQGEIFKADSEFAKNSFWINRNLGNQHIKIIENNYFWGKMLEANGVLDLKNALKEASFEKSLSLMKKKYSETHYLAFDIYESLMKNYLHRGENGKYREISNEFEKIIKKNFKKTSIHYATISTIQFNTKLDKNKTSKLLVNAGSLLTSNSAIPKYHKKRVEVLAFLTKVALSEKNYKHAESYLTDLLEIKRNLFGELSPEFHLSKIKLANFYLDFTSKFKEAGEIYNTSFEGIIEKEIDIKHVDYIDILNHMALYFEQNDDYKKASETLKDALIAAQTKYQNTDIAYGIELDKIANLKINIGEYQEAEEYIKNAMSILIDHRKNDNDIIHYIKALETKAKLEAIKGDFEEAENHISAAQKLLRKTDDKVGYNELSSQEELAYLDIALGKYSATEKILLNVINTYQKLYGKESRNIIRPLTNYGKLKLITGDYTEAEKITRRVNNLALSIYGENSTKTASTYILLAELTTTLGDYDKAYEYISKAIPIQETAFGRNHIEVARSIAQKGLILYYQGGFNDKSERLLRESVSIIAQSLGKSNPMYAVGLKDLASIEIAQKKYNEAFNSLELSEKIWISKVGKRNNINAAEIYVLTGDLYYHQYSYDRAEEYYGKAKTLYEKFFSDKHPDYIKVISKLSKVYYMKGETNKAENTINEAIDNYNLFIKNYFPSLSEREKTKFWNTIKQDFEFFNTLALSQTTENKKLMEKVYNNALTTKALLLSSSIKIRQNIMTSGDKELIENYEKWLSNKDLLTQALSMNSEQLTENNINPSQLAREVELLEKELSQKSDAFKSDDSQITWESIRESLGPNEVAIEMIRFRHFNHVFTDSVIYAVLYLKNQKGTPRPSVSLITNGKDLENKYFKSYRNSIIYKIEDRYSKEAYWEPIKNIAGNNATIYLSSDGVYNQINLETIPTSDNKYVLDDSNIILVSNTKDVYINKNKAAQEKNENRILMFGNPDFYLSANASNQIANLPGTKKEIDELKDLLLRKGWIAQDYMDVSAREEQLKLIDSPKVFHIATHGFFRGSDDMLAQKNSLNVNRNKTFDNPLLRTGLLLTGAGDILDKTKLNYNTNSGILTAYEAMNLNLDRTELVVLSACETGLGDLQVGEGVYGLQRAFLVAGAKSLIMSMFKVDDAATQKLMVSFYQKWLETGQMRQSFINAKKEVRNEYHEPIYWGSFIMIGME
ncbi:MAG: CHAT domain-containing protein [Cyclobacteriaceae bacterium]|nr:CHAT domain-containing protein [Cyclobacteriaceae bacterium]